MTEQKTTGVAITLQHGLQFRAEDRAGVKVILDAAPPLGESAGMSPMQLLLVALGGCTAMDVISILRKKRQDVTDYRVEVEGVRAIEHPQVFTDITIRHVVAGNKLSEEGVRRSIELSEEKYCSVMAMLRQSAKISSVFEILPAASVDTLPVD